METVCLPVDPLDPDPASIARAVEALRAGDLVAFPTETVYGLGADATNPEAVKKVFAAKARPSDDPLIVHIHPDWELETAFSEPPTDLVAAARRHWPGPLTLVADRAETLAPAVSARLETVAARAPAHPVALAMLEGFGRPIAAPSANVFGHVSPTSARHVLDDLDGRCRLILDAGDSPLGIESTVVRFEGTRVIVLRRGAFDPGEMGVDVVEFAGGQTAQAPGTSLRHYAPHTPMAVVGPGFAGRLAGDGGVYVGYDDSVVPPGWQAVSLGDRDDVVAVAAGLYATLRRVDRLAADRIVAELSGVPGLGMAIDDRLYRAAAGRTLESSP